MMGAPFLGEPGRAAKKIVKWARDLRKIGDKSAVIASEIRETTDGGDIRRYRPFSNRYRFNFVGVDLNAIARDVIAKVQDFVLRLGTFVRIQNKIFFVMRGEFLFHILLVRLVILRVDNDVVEIDHHAIVYKFAKDVIHHGLESSGRVGETERDGTEVKMTITTGKCGLFFGIIGKTYLPIARAKVRCRKDDGVHDIHCIEPGPEMAKVKAR
jgi:hypothetical protein